ncbi:hypothetical protein O9992_00780 [Vibrio lentus]|nr:hypothetical protein [Vibrio lentus]
MLEKLNNILPVGCKDGGRQRTFQEEANFDQVENEVLWYAGSAAGCDLIPVLAWCLCLRFKRKCSIVWQISMGLNGIQSLQRVDRHSGEAASALQYGMKLGTRYS